MSERFFVLDQLDDWRDMFFVVVARKDPCTRRKGRQPLFGREVPLDKAIRRPNHVDSGVMLRRGERRAGDQHVISTVLIDIFHLFP